MNLDELVRQDVVTAQSHHSIGDVVRKMEQQNVGAVVIVDDERHVVGIVTDRDLALHLGVHGASPQTSIDQIMTRDVITIWHDEGIFNATQYFLGHQIRRLPVIDREDRLVGMIAVDDVLALLARELFNVARALEPALGERI